MSMTTPASRQVTRATIAEGDNRNRDEGKDTCASMATMSAHLQRATTQGDATTNWQTRGKREKMRQRTKGGEAPRGQPL